MTAGRVSKGTQGPQLLFRLPFLNLRKKELVAKGCNRWLSVLIERVGLCLFSLCLAFPMMPCILIICMPIYAYT